jgi:hypothetical protein
MWFAMSEMFGRCSHDAMKDAQIALWPSRERADVESTIGLNDCGFRPTIDVASPAGANAVSRVSTRYRLLIFRLSISSRAIMRMFGLSLVVVSDAVGRVARCRGRRCVEVPRPGTVLAAKGAQTLRPMMYGQNFMTDLMACHCHLFQCRSSPGHVDALDAHAAPNQRCTKRPVSIVTLTQRRSGKRAAK